MLSGKRLAPYMEEITRVLERCGELELDPVTRQNLLSVSAATIDRLMASERRRIALKGRKGTKPGTPSTPYQRLMENPAISRKHKAALKAEYESLNPAQLKRKIIKLQGKLFTYIFSSFI